jgi:hypothetical protein
VARPGRRAVGLGLTVVLVALALLAADAATLGGLAPRTLASFNVNGTVTTPTIVGCDNFTGTTGATMNGRAVTVAANCTNRTWTTHVGTWTIQANQAASSATAGAVATLNTASTAATATVVLASLNVTGRVAGIVMDHNGGAGATASFVQVLVTAGAPSRVDVRIFALGISVAPVASNTNVTLAATNTLSLSRVGTAVTVRLNGAVVVTYTLTATDVLTLANGRAGLVGGDANVRFDDFVVTVP